MSTGQLNSLKERGWRISVESSKLAEIFTRGGNVDGMCFFGGVVPTGKGRVAAIDPDLSVIVTVTFIETNTFQW